MSDAESAGDRGTAPCVAPVTRVGGLSAHRGASVLDLVLRAAVLLAGLLAMVWFLVTFACGLLRSPTSLAIAALSMAVLVNVVVQSLTTFGDMNRPLMTFYPTIAIILFGCVSTLHLFRERIPADTLRQP